jgi:hypothetical protein
MADGDLQVPAARINPGGDVIKLEIQTGINNFTSFSVGIWDLAAGSYVPNKEWGGHDAPGDDTHPIITLGSAAAMAGKRVVVAVQLIVRAPADNVEYRCDAMITQGGNSLASDAHIVKKKADLLFYGQIWIDCE